MSFNIDDIDAFVFDFDGVMTDNLVHIDQDGKEWVSCNRGDGLAFDLLHKISKPAYILSTEKNPVIAARAKKLKIPALQGVTNKVIVLHDLIMKEGYELNRICYVGNDLNDYLVMKECGVTVCPVDSHPAIQEIAMITLKTKGGQGAIRELLEDVFNLDFIGILYSE